MTAIELARLVADMRATQRIYFKERKHAQLGEAIKKEQIVDKAVEEILATTSELLPGMDP